MREKLEKVIVRFLDGRENEVDVDPGAYGVSGAIDPERPSESVQAWWRGTVRKNVRVFIEAPRD